VLCPRLDDPNGHFSVIRLKTATKEKGVVFVVFDQEDGGLLHLNITIRGAFTVVSNLVSNYLPLPAKFCIRTARPGAKRLPKACIVKQNILQTALDPRRVQGLRAH
jgi:hypothetical protein